MANDDNNGVTISVNNTPSTDTVNNTNSSNTESVNVQHVDNVDTEKNKQIANKVLNGNVPDTKDDNNTAKVTQQFAVYNDIKDREEWLKKVDEMDVGDITVPTTTPREFYKVFADRPNIDTNSREQVTFLRALQSAYQSMPGHKSYQSTTEDTERDFYQEIDSGEGKLRAFKPKFGFNDNIKLTGEVAATRISMLLGNGGLISIPLYHSGFWVTIKKPSEQRLLDLEYEVFSSKVELGRRLGGAIFSNDQVYLSKAVTKLFEDCIYTTTLKSKNEDILSKIKAPDLQLIAWGLASAIYPNGYPYSRAKISSDGYSDELIHGMISIDKLLWVDRQSLSEKQIKHMTKRFKPNMTDESLEEYQNEFVNNTKRVKLKDGLECVLHQPSVLSHLESGEEWVESCISAVDAVITQEVNEDERNALINRYAKAMYLGQYKHYIKEIIYVNGEHEESYSDEESIDALVKVLSEDSEIRNNFLNEVLKFIDKSVVAIIATPTVSDSESNITPRFPELVPMDAMYVFFNLTIQLTKRITNRGNQDLT